MRVTASTSRVEVAKAGPVAALVAEEAALPGESVARAGADALDRLGRVEVIGRRAAVEDVEGRG